MTFSIAEAVCIAGQLAGELRGKAVESGRLLPRAEVLRRNGFVNVTDEEFAEAVAGKRVGAATAEGLWINLPLSPDVHLLLGEAVGSLRYHLPGDPVQIGKAHLRLDFDDGSCLVETVGGLGFIRIAHGRTWRGVRYPSELGVSPLDGARFTPAALDIALRANGTKPVRVALVDQRQVAGLTNAYLSDIFFAAGVHPGRRAADLTEEEVGRLHAAIGSVMRSAAGAGGDVRQKDIYDDPGGYQFLMGRHLLGHACPRCGGTIEKVQVGAAANYICPVCQPLAVRVTA